LAGGGITNHEVFAFGLQGADANVGALIADVSVFLNTVFVAEATSYELTLTAVDENLNPSNAAITGQFHSNGV
jgi:hypothetical protein